MMFAKSRTSQQNYIVGATIFGKHSMNMIHYLVNKMDQYYMVLQLWSVACYNKGPFRNSSSIQISQNLVRL